MSEYKLRRDSLISPWGVGAIAPFPNDESLIISGLDNWFADCTYIEEFEVHDARLSGRMNNKVFYMPPDFRQRTKENNEIRIPAYRFPLWNYCPICGNMEKLSAGSDTRKCSGDMRRKGSKQSYCNKNQGNPKKMRNLIPERFVAVCEDGHIEDFPVAEWIHQDGFVYNSKTCKINRTTGGGTSSLAGVRYTCTCGASRSMVGAFAKGALDRIGYYCTGNRPWLAGNPEGCCKSLQVIQRGASNAWFAEVVSSIYIPTESDLLSDAEKRMIDKAVEKFQSQRTNGQCDRDSIKEFVGLYAMIESVQFNDTEMLVDMIISKICKKDSHEQISEDQYRLQEYSVLEKSYGEPKSALFVEQQDMSAYKGISYVSSISLVHKLKETRVFTGFRRLKKEAPLVEDLSSHPIDWLPAIQNSGEGIFIKFDYGELRKWASKPDVRDRIGKIHITSEKDKDKTLNPVFVLLHTFAHCAIIALSSDSGYSTAAIRERIYCSQFEEDDVKMAAVLIYTASGDSEGSLGGLVRQGLPGRMENILLRALHEATWCASDPVCIQSEGQGQDGCNLAACHNCALLPETSCEKNNRTLDRGVLIGTLENPSVGFFSDVLKSI